MFLYMILSKIWRVILDDWIIKEGLKKSKERFLRLYISLMQRGTYIYTYDSLVYCLDLQIIKADLQEVICWFGGNDIAVKLRH